jgi:hypothetical protein
MVGLIKFSFCCASGSAMFPLKRKERPNGLSFSQGDFIAWHYILEFQVEFMLFEVAEYEGIGARLAFLKHHLCKFHCAIIISENMSTS